LLQGERLTVGTAAHQRAARMAGEQHRNTALSRGHSERGGIGRYYPPRDNLAKWGQKRVDESPVARFWRWVDAVQMLRDEQHRNTVLSRDHSERDGIGRYYPPGDNLAKWGQKRVDESPDARFWRWMIPFKCWQANSTEIPSCLASIRNGMESGGTIPRGIIWRNRAKKRVDESPVARFWRWGDAVQMLADEQHRNTVLSRDHSEQGGIGRYYPPGDNLAMHCHVVMSCAENSGDYRRKLCGD